MKRIQSDAQMHHKQFIKFEYVIRNSSTGAYLCDEKLKRKIFSTYSAAESEKKRLNLSDFSYETEILISKY